MSGQHAEGLFHDVVDVDTSQLDTVQKKKRARCNGVAWLTTANRELAILISGRTEPW